MARFIFITGTDTGVGKTVLTSLLVRHLRSLGRAVAAIKPVCSGSRDDARLLFAALEGTLALDAINPWHFRAALAPSLAARLEGRRLAKSQVLEHLRGLARRFEIVLVEGAGGLLSPLGQDFDSRDLILALRATALVVAPNRLGAVNQVRLVLAALPASALRRAAVALMNPCRPEAASASNAVLLGEFFPARAVHTLPWLESRQIAGRKPAGPAAERVMQRLARVW